MNSFQTAMNVFNQNVDQVNSGLQDSLDSLDSSSAFAQQQNLYSGQSRGLTSNSAVAQAQQLTQQQKQTSAFDIASDFSDSAQYQQQQIGTSGEAFKDSLQNPDATTDLLADTFNESMDQTGSKDYSNNTYSFNIGDSTLEIPISQSKESAFKPIISDFVETVYGDQSQEWKDNLVKQTLDRFNKPW